MATWSIPELPPIEKKENKRLDTTKLDEAFSLSRYLEKHGFDKVEEWKELRKQKKKKTKKKVLFNQKMLLRSQVSMSLN